MQGRVTVQFVIGRTGSVTSATADADLADPGVADCVQRAFYGLKFPPPEGGSVSVTYPVVFTPGG